MRPVHERSTADNHDDQAFIAQECQCPLGGSHGHAVGLRQRLDGRDTTGQLSALNLAAQYYLGRCQDALDDATTALRRTPGVDPGWREEFTQDLAVLRSKLDILRTLMNGRQAAGPPVTARIRPVSKSVISRVPAALTVT